ncbi:flavoprotein [Geosporobacter ferrireducens]|uniref:Flavoprotein n=1 Tax=Geosporobacter ferrireducens TaxID=1424294 RepID=A0A1D8GPB4_9FIRM|nr:flavoprotein [Geosporobacter ferrireducens]AOT72718.1 flavoprotein [Geosporobacter ferrireducens]MTI55127.1 flavoprotein [Geosporobacter ferrireducens]
MDINAILDEIVNEVVKKLQNRPRSALILFTGASIGFPDAIKQLKCLKEERWKFKVLLSNSAEYVLTPELVNKELGVQEVYLEREITSMKFLYSDIELIIIATMTLNTAVKISIGIADTLVTNIAAHAIMEGIPILAAKDACDLENPVRKQLGMNKSPIAYLDKMTGHLKALSSYGIKLVDAGDLHCHAKDLNLFTGSTTATNSISKISQVHKKVISRADIIDAAAGGDHIIISPQTIITSLARDAAKELGIKFCIQEG